jgi:Flp pilus assembly protein TadD
VKHHPLRSLLAIVAFLLFTLIGAQQPAQAKDTWTSVHSKNFTLVGNASEKDIRLVANRLEQFREVFALLFPATKLNSPVPMTVIVFKNDSSYKPFKVKPNIDGYFQPGADVNYITLASEKGAADQVFTTIFHEYVHLLIENTMGTTMPLWFNEGLAEYYSTLSISDDDRTVLLGNLIGNHVLYLRRNKIVPLPALFGVDYNSPYYNEGNKMNVFYAESWMLVHYILQGDEQKRRPKLGKFIELLKARMPISAAFQQAFQTDLASFERDFRTYIQGAKYMATAVTFEKSLDFDSEMQSTPLTEAEVHAFLGDLLLHIRHFDDAERQLAQALQLNPDLPMAQASYGMLRVHDGRLDEARRYLQTAVAANSQNFLTHFYYALALSSLGVNEYHVVSSYSPEAAAVMRTELKKAIALKPDFPESYALLGFVNLVRNEEIDETINLLKGALNISHGNNRIVFILAQLYARKQNFADAEALLEPLALDSSDPEVRNQAEKLLANMKRVAAFKESSPPETVTGPALANPPVAADLDSALAAALRKPGDGETRVQGNLTAIECKAKGIVFEVHVGDRFMRFHTDSFDHVKFNVFTRDSAIALNCGPWLNQPPVVVTYAAAKAAVNADDETAAIEFVPKSFVLKP